MTNSNMMSFDAINDMMNVAMTTQGETTMLKPVNAKTEQQAAEAIVPMLFGAIAQMPEFVLYTTTQQQLAAASLFRTLFNMQGQYNIKDFMATVIYDQAELNKRNRDKDQLDMNEVALSLCLKVALGMGFVTETGYGTDAHYFSISEKFVDTCSVKMATAPSDTPIDNNNRATSMIKGDRVKACPMLAESITFQQQTAFSINKIMVSITQQVRRSSPKLAIWKDIRNSMAGVEAMNAESDYYSEINADSRGRTYFASHYGANPQGCDYNRSVFALKGTKVVVKDSLAYHMFMSELAEAAGKNKTYMAHATLMRAAANPVVALTKMLELGLVAAPFTYIRLALDYATFDAMGQCNVSVPVGLDAKCSGTQILSILAGNMELLAATGFSEVKVADPYMLCAKALGGDADRNTMKQPYMVVQYGGGAKSLEDNLELMEMMARRGLGPAAGSKLVIAAVKKVLGRKIVSMQEAIAGAVLTRLKDTGATSLEYKHLDGQTVKYTVCDTVDITGEYTEIRYTQSTVIGFGSKERDTGLTVSTGIPSADEFARTFMVNYVQGLDALIARTVAAFAKDAGLKGYVSIHDCFRTELADAPLLMNVIRDAYNHLFVKHDPLAHLAKQIGFDTVGLDRILTSEMVYQENAYFFCQ